MKKKAKSGSVKTVSAPKTALGSAPKADSLMAGLLLCALLIFVPLYIENAYFNVVEAKGHALLLTAAAFWIVALILLAATRDVKAYGPKTWNVGDWAIAAGGVTALISSLLSGHITASLIGSEGWRVGGIAIISVAGMYFFMSRRLENAEKWLLAPVAVSDIIFLIGLMHTAGYDIFRLHDNIAPNQFFTYASTLGNINAHVGYLSLMIPLLLVWYLKTASDPKASKAKRAFLLVSLEMALADVVVCASDGIFVGLGFCAFFFVPYLMGDRRRVGCIFPVMGIYGLILLMFGRAAVFAEKRMTIEGLARIFIKAPAAAALIVVGILGFVLFKYKENLLTDKVLKVAGVIMEMVLAAAFIYFAADLIRNFSDDWGTKRGLIWRTSFEAFRGFSPREMLFGIGPERQSTLYESLRIHGMTVKVSHSEPIQILLSMGLAGLGAWGVFWGSLMAIFVRKRVYEKPCVLFALPLLSYFAQSFVNSAMATNVAVLCVMAAAYRRLSD